MRWLLRICLALVVIAAAALGTLFAFADRYDLAPLVAARLSASLERRVTLGSLHVTPGRWLHFELHDFQVDNLPNGSQPIMAKIANASADINAMSLLHGPAMLRVVTVTGLQLLLEHTTDGKKNWKFGEAAQSAPARPSSWTRFPNLLDAQITGDVVFRTSSGHPLDARLDGIQFRSEAADRPLHLTGSGSYGGAPIKLEANLGSLNQLRAAANAYPSDIRVASNDATLHFHGTMTQPLDLDGMKGILELVAPTITPLLVIGGSSGNFDAALRLAGPFEHDGRVWALSQASGALNADAITGANVKFEEGLPGNPDNLAVELAFDHLDANALLAAKTKGPGSDADLPLTIDRAPDTLVAVKITAAALAYSGVRATNATFGGSLQPGRVTVDAFSFGYLGAPFRVSGQIEAVPGFGDKDGGRVTATVEMTRMDAQALRKLLDAGNLPLLGRVNGKVLVEAAGPTLNAAAHDARLSAVFTMEQGSIARRIIELASTDVRTAFRKTIGMSPLTCLLGLLDIRAGVGTISPLRIRTADGAITGRGSFDIYRRQLDITVTSDARTTSLFALDVPVHVSGSFASPTIQPAELSAAGRAQMAAGDDVSRLLPSLQPFAQHSPCLVPRAR